MSEEQRNWPSAWSKDGIRKSELPWTPEGFHYIDTNNDNLLSKEELTNAYQAFDIKDRGKTWSDGYYDALADGNLSSANLDNDITKMSYEEAMFDAYGYEVNEANKGKSAEELERLRNNMNLDDFKTKYGEKEYMQLARHDNNVDGVLTKNEVKTGATLTEQELTDLLKQKETIMQDMKTIGLEGSSTLTKLANNFDSVDPNKDGFLDADEIVKKQNITLEQAQNTVKKMDLDNNNQLSLGEAAYAVNLNKDIDLTTLGNNQTKLSEYDLNKDNKITKAEIIQHDKELKQKNYKNVDNKSESKGLSTGAIIGIVIGAVFLVGLIVGLIVYFARKKKSNNVEKGQTNRGEKEKNIVEQEEIEGNSFDKNNDEANYKIDNFNAISNSMV